MSTKKAAFSTPLLIFLPLLTIWFHKYCKSRFEPAFRKYPLEVSQFRSNILSFLSLCYEIALRASSDRVSYVWKLECCFDFSGSDGEG
jgi:hypothetical protein